MLEAWIPETVSCIREALEKVQIVWRMASRLGASALTSDSLDSASSSAALLTLAVKPRASQAHGASISSL